MSLLPHDDLLVLQGKRVVGADGSEGYSDLHQENSLLQMENDKLRTRIKALHETVETLRMHNANLVAERDSMSKNGRHVGC